MKNINKYKNTNIVVNNASMKKKYFFLYRCGFSFFSEKILINENPKYKYDEIHKYIIKCYQKILHRKPDIRGYLESFLSFLHKENFENYEKNILNSDKKNLLMKK